MGMFFDNWEMKEFLSRFKFKRNKSGFIGVERECFLVFPDGNLAPKSEEFLLSLDDKRWTYELSACQVESRTKPHKDLSSLKLELLENDNAGQNNAKKLGLVLIHQEIGDENMPLNVYPDSRYIKIVETISRDRLVSACRVAGTHLHIGVKNIRRAIEIYNLLVAHLNKLCDLGDHSNGERLRLYKTMAINWNPVVYDNEKHFFEIAKKQGFVDNPRNCWHLIRISIHGTVELRMFGATDKIDEIIYWTSFVKSLINASGISI